MSHYQKPPELYDGLRLHQNENTGGCSPRVLEALARAAAGSDRLLPAVRGGDRRGRELPRRRRPTRSRCVNGLDEGIMALAVAYLRAVDRRPAARSDRAGAGVRDLPVRHGGRRRRARAGDAARRLQLPARRGAGGDHAEHARRVPDQPEQSDGRGDAARGDPRDRAARAAGRGRVRRRGVRRVRRRQLHPRARRVPERHRRPHVLEGVRPGRAAHRLPGRRAGDARRRSGARCRSTASTSPPWSAVHGGARRSRSPATATCAQVAESKALLYAACDRLGLALLDERRRTSCSCAPATGPTRS